jgi:rRNA maturation endonuclease Nob1
MEEYECIECGKILEEESEDELCQSCLNETIRNEQSFQEELTESWNHR